MRVTIRVESPRQPRPLERHRFRAQVQAAVTASQAVFHRTCHDESAWTQLGELGIVSESQPIQRAMSMQVISERGQLAVDSKQVYIQCAGTCGDSKQISKEFLDRRMRNCRAGDG